MPDEQEPAVSATEPITEPASAPATLEQAPQPAPAPTPEPEPNTIDLDDFLNTQPANSFLQELVSVLFCHHQTHCFLSVRISNLL